VPFILPVTLDIVCSAIPVVSAGARLDLCFALGWGRCPSWGKPTSVVVPLKFPDLGKTLSTASGPVLALVGLAMVFLVLPVVSVISSSSETGALPSEVSD
jgi:hypothetical protein